MSIHQRRYLSEMNIIRAIAILAVILIHSTSNAVVSSDVQSSFYFIYVLLNKMSSFAVPLFLFLSGFVLMYSYQDKELTLPTAKQFLSRRIVTVIVPYFFVSCFYFVLKNIHNLSIESIGRLINAILNGTAYTHLYYVFVIAQFYLIFPIMWASIRYSRKSAIWIWIIGFLIQWAYFYLNQSYLAGMSDLPSLLKRPGSLFMSYTAYFGCGVWLATKYEVILQKLQKHSALHRLLSIALGLLWIGSGVYYAYLFYMGNKEKIWATSTYFAWIWFVLIMNTIAFFMVTARSVELKMPKPVLRWVTSLSDYSFSIYLLHPFLLYIYRRLPISGNPVLYHLYFVGQFLFGWLVTWLIVFVLAKYLPFGKYLIGKGKQSWRV